MRTAVSDTSIAQYHSMRADGVLTRQQRQVFEFLARHCERDWTRKEIGKAIDMEPGTVAGRVWELIDLKQLEELPIRKCNVSGKSAHPVRVVPLQTELFAA